MKRFFAALLLAMLSSTASALVMDFDSGTYDGTNYFEGNFTWVSIFSGGGHTHTAFVGSTSSTGLYNHGGGCCSNPYQLTENSSAAFSLTSVWVEYANAPMEFIGSNAVVNTIAQGFSGLYAFSGLTNVTSVTWNLVNDANDGLIDNLTINAAVVPEPAAGLLLALGLLGLVAFRRKDGARG